MKGGWGGIEDGIRKGVCGRICRLEFGGQVITWTSCDD